MSAPLTSQSEVARVLREQADYYAVLRIGIGERGKGLTPDLVRAAARSVALHVHPDRATSRGVLPADATAAAAIVNMAAATLGDPLKKRMYDMWAGSAGAVPGKSFAEWEAGGAFAAAPAWLRRLLARRGGAVCVALTGLVLLIPILLILIVLTILCLPVRAVLWCCGVRGSEEGAEGEAAGGDRPGDVEMGAPGTPGTAPGAAGGGTAAPAAAPPVIVLGPAGG